MPSGAPQHVVVALAANADSGARLATICRPAEVFEIAPG
jgi:hypothetical protein